MALETKTTEADQRSDDDIVFSPLAKRLMWVEKAANVTLLVKGLAVLCVLLVLGDLIIHRHSYWSLESWFGFYAFAGFVAFALIVLLAKQLRRIIKRPEDYYSPNAVDAESYPESGLDRQSAYRTDEPATNGRARESRK